MAIANDGAKSPAEIKAQWRARPAEHSALQQSDLAVSRLVADVPKHLATMGVPEKSNHLVALLGRLL